MLILRLDLEMLDAAEFCYFGIDLLMRSFCDVLVPGQRPEYKKGNFGTYRPAYDRSTMSNSDKFDEDQVVLMEALPEFAFIALYKIPIPGEDEFTKGMRNMIKTKRVSLWLSFAAQVYLDIHHTLRANVSKGFQELRITGLRAKKTVDEYFKFSKSLPNPIWPKQMDLNLEDVQRTVDNFILKDVLASQSTQPVAKGDEFLFLKWHPVQAGLLMFNINLRLQDIGINLVNTFGSVTYLAYLYNTVQKEGVVSVDW